MLPELDDYHWAEAFGFAGESGRENYGRPKVGQPFSRTDVKMIIARREGVQDEIPWLMVGQLHSGDYFFLSAGCDYTGWD